MKLPLEILEGIVDTLNVGLVVLDKDDKIVLFNRKAGEMLQQDPKERIGSPLLRCHPARAEPGVLKMIGEIKSGKLEKYDGWVKFIGRIIYEYIYPIRDKDGKYVAIVAEFHDAAEKAEYLKGLGEWTKPDMHGTGDSSPRSPHAEP
ncbi:MAG: PAS domain-containing protein, partial [Candidatus Thorarchaeota archaeon]